LTDTDSDHLTLTQILQQIYAHGCQSAILSKIINSLVPWQSSIILQGFLKIAFKLSV